MAFDTPLDFERRKAAWKQRHADNRESNLQHLQAAGIYFTSHNGGAHLIVAERWDFWPGTGRFNERKGRPGQPKREGRGIRNLLAILKEDVE